MSRTWKDRPSYVQANDKRNQKNAHEYHYCGASWTVLKEKLEERTVVYDWGDWKEEKTYFRKVVTLWGSEYTDCDLEEENIRDSQYQFTGCHYVPNNRFDWKWNRDKVRKDGRKTHESSIRAERQNKTKRLKDEYNVSGTVEEDYYFHDNKQKGWWWSWD